LGKYIHVAVTSSGNSGDVDVWTDTSVTAAIVEFDLEGSLDTLMRSGTSAAPLGTVVFPAGFNISDNWAAIATTVKAKSKYVILDLSACVASNNTIEGLADYIGASGNHFNII